MTCPNGCGMPLRLDVTFERDAVHYGVNRRRWFCPLGHTVWQPVARVPIRPERPVEPLVPSGAKCRLCRRPLRQDSGVSHRHCLERRKRRRLLQRLREANAILPKRACRTCRKSFQPTTPRNIDCEKCRRFRNCPVCSSRHYPDGRHLVGTSLQWATSGRSSHKRKIAAAYKEGRL